MDTQRNRLIETILSSTQNKFKLMSKKIITILHSKFWFIWIYVLSVNDMLAKFKTGFVEAVENRGSYMSFIEFIKQVWEKW